MIIPTLGAVQTLQGLLAKIDLNGHTSIIRQGSTIEPGESVVLLSGSSQLNLFNNLPIIDLAINQPFSLDGISPLLKAGNTEVIQQLIEDALIKGLDISQLLAALEATAAGDATVLGSGGNAYILDPMFGFGLVTAGYDTRGLSSLNAQETDYVGNMVQLYGNTKPEAYLAFSDNDLSLDESLTVRNGDFNAGDQNGIVDPFNFGQVIGFAEGFLVSAASSQFNQPAERVTSSYALELGNGASSLKASNGSPITLSLDGNKIIATSEGKVIFAIGIDPANGKITIVQYHGIYHPNANSADESIDLSNLIRITLTLTDSSGDKSTASLDIGSKIHFEDDAPFMHGVDSIQLNDNTNIGLVITGSVNVDFNTDLAKDLVFADSALDALRAINLTSNGQALFFSMDEQAHTITATNEAQQVIFTLTLSEVRANHVQTDMPHYELHVYESIDQPLNNEITISIPIKAIDADNDSVIGNLVINIDDGSDAEGGISTSFIAVEGDLDAITGGYPVTTNHQFSITAGIDRLVPESLTIDSGFLNNLINEFQNEVTASGSALTLTQNSVNGVITLTATDTQNNTVFQLIITPQNSGKDLSINVTLIQYKPLDHDASGDSTGLIRQDGQSLHIDLQLQAQDSDGDALTNPVNLKVTINDGGAPALGNHQLIFTENLTTQTQSGQVPLNLGSDVISTLVFENTATMQNSLNDLTSGGKQTSYSFESDNKVLVLKIDDASSPLNGQEILRVTINPDGSYTATLSGPLDQVNEISELLLDVRATDKDGDSSNLGQIKIIINDAVNQPYPTQASTNIVEGDLSPGTYPISSPLVNFTLQTSGDRLLPETVKFDPATINTLIAELNQEIKFDGQPLTFTVTGNTITGSLNGVDILVIELTANQNTNNYDVDAHIKVTLNAPIDHNQNNSTGSVHLQGDQINIILGVQIQDAEGDYLAQPALINAGISDGANPVLSTQESININEPVTGAATIGQASFVIDIGSDPIDHLGFNYTAGENSGLKSAGHDVLFEVDNGVLKGYYLDGSTRVEVLRATLSNNTTSGQVHFELFKPLDHSQLGQDSLSLNLKIQAIDTDGDSANLTLPVNIVDSIAHPVGGVATVIEGETVTGSLAGFYNLNVEGGHLYSVVVENTTYSFANNQTTYVINTAKGELTINSDGTWKLVSVDGLDHDFTQELVVGYSVIDGDGDISLVNNLVIGINDGAPSTGGQTLTTGLNEGDLAPITYPTHVLSPSLTLVNNGSDPFDLSTLAILNQANLANELQNDIKFFSITTGQEESVVATVTNDTITLKSASGELVLEIKLIPIVQPNGDILLQQDITLYQPLSQLIANSGGSVQIIGDQIRITYGVQVIDIDGDALTNPVTISALINDGVNPDLINTVATSVIDGSNQTNGNLNLNIGSDPIATITFNSSQPLLSGLTSNGFATTQEVSAHSVKIFDSNHNLIVEITVADNGAYTVQINGPLDQGIGNILAIPLNVTVVDKDGDQDTALLTVNIVDGLNPQGGNVVNLAVTEGSLSVINGYPVSNTQNLTIVSGSDRLVPGTVTIDSTVIAAIISELTSEVKSAGQTITYTYDSSTHVLTGKIGSETVLTFTLNATQNANGHDVDATITFTQYKPLDHSLTGNNTGYVQVNGTTITITTPVQISDSDGDKLTNPVSVKTTITDGVLPVINTIAPILVKESDINASTGNHAGSSAAATGETASGQITVLEGSDKVVSYSLDMAAFNAHTNGSWTSGGLPINLVLSSTTATTSVYSGVVVSGSTTITKFTLTLDNQTGAYTFRLLGSIDHPLVQGKNTTDVIFIVNVKDADGDSNLASAQLPITIQDDIPTAANITFAQIVEGGTTTTTDIINVSREGADTGKVVSIIDGTTEHVIVGTGYNQFTIYDSLGTQVIGVLNIRADGSTFFVSNNNINHDALVLNKVITFNIRDADGDTASANIIINIADKAPTISLSASGVEDQGRDANEVIVSPVTAADGIPVTMNINIGDYDNGETISSVLIQVPAVTHGTFYYNGAPLAVVNGHYVIPTGAFTTTNNINYSLNGVTFIPDADYSSTGIAFTVKATVTTANNQSQTATGTLNITVLGIADAPTWDMAQTQTYYQLAEDTVNAALQVKAALQDTDGSESIDYYLIKINAGDGVLSGTGLSAVADANGYYKISAANVGTLQVNPADDYSGPIKVEVISVSKEASNFVPGQQYAQSAPIILTVDVNPVADPIKLNITKPYFVSNEDTLINMSTVINLFKGSDNLDGSEQTYIRLSGIPEGAHLVLHGVNIDVSGLAAGLNNLSITYTDNLGQHTVSYQYFNDVSNSSNSYYQFNTTDISSLQLQPVPESNVDFILKVQGVVIDTAVLSNGQQVTDTKITDAQLVTVNMKGVADIPVFDVTGTSWTVTPAGVETTIPEDGQVRLDFDVLSGEKNLAPTDTSETLTMVISGIPVGAQLLDSNGNTVTLTYVGLDGNGQPRYEVNLNSLDDLIFIPPANSTADVTLNAHLVVTENDGNSLVVDKQIIIHVTPVIDAGNYSKTSYGAEDGLVNINWTPPAFSDGQESISGISFNNIPDGSRLLINGTFITAIGDTSVTLTAAQVQQLLNGATLQLKAPEDSDVDVNLNSIVTVSQSDVDGTGIVTKDITGNLHLDIRAVVEPDANLQVIAQADGSVITSLTAINGSVIDLSTGANSQAQVKFQDLDASSVETIKVMVISGLGSQFVVVGGIYDGVGNWIVPESGLDSLQIISKHGYNGTINITIHTQVQDMGDNNEGDVSVLATRQTSLSLTFTGSGGGPGDPITEAGVISINDTVIIGQEDIPVTFGAQLAGMLTLTGGTPDDVYALIIEGPLPEGFSLTGSGVVYDFVHDRYIISATSDGMGGLTVGQVFLETPEDYSGTLPFDVNWVATNMESGDINQGAAPVSIPVDITPIVDIPPAVTLQVVQTEGLDADKQPVGSGNEVTYPNVAYEDGLITLDLNVISADNDGSEQIGSVLVKVDPTVGAITDANGVPFAVDANGFVSIPVADIDSIKLKPVSDYSGPVHLTVQVGLVDSAVDSNGNTITDTDSYTKDLTFNILPINDPVTYTNANNFVFTGNEDVSGGVAFSGLTVHTNDSDGSEKIVSLVISGVPDGFLIGSAQNMGNGEWKVTVNNSNFDLSNIKLIPPDDFSGTVNLQVTAYTKEALATLPTAGGTQAFSVVVNPVSDVVDIIGAGAASNLSGIENGSINVALNIQARDDTDTYTGTSPNVSENAPETLLLTIKGVPNTAEIELPAGVDGSLVSKIFDTNTNTWTWVFTVNESQLTNIVFLPGDSNGAIELIVQAQAVDGNAVPGPVKEIIVDVDVTAVNDAPVNIIPASFNASEDQPIVLNGIQISDIDAREINGAMTVTLEVAHGNLTLGTSPGVTLSGNGTSLVVVTGSIDAINALLASGVGYQGALNFNGQDSLKMTTNDNGNSGGPALTAETIVPISVVAVNDAPVNTIAPSYNAIEDQALVLNGIQVSDVDALETNGLMTVTLEVLHGNLNIGTNPQVSISGNNSSVITLSGTLDAINSLLATGVSYQGDLNYNGQDSLKMTTNDGGNSGGAALSTESIALIEVAAVNDAPVNTVPVLPIDASEDQAVILTNIQVNDVDAAEANGQITVTFDVQHGSLSLLGNPAGVSVTNNNSSNLILVGTQAAINSALASGLSYQADANFHGTDSLTMTTNDNGNSGGSSLIDIDVAQIVIAPRADTPELTLLSQSMVAALGALIPLQIAADVINPVPNEVSVKIDGLGNAVIVDNEGNAIGNSLGNGSWELNSDQLSNVYLQNLEEGEHTIVVTAVSDVNDGQPQESVPQNINVNVVDATQNDLEGGGTNDHIIGSELNDVLIGIFGDDLLEGKGGDDILIGGEGNDVLIGGRGNDTLTGGEGSDVFKWEAEDHGTLGLPEVDIVTDFNPQEDKLDLSNLLQGEHSGNYENYLHFEYDANGNYTTISISTNGGFNGSETAPAEVLSKSDQLIVVNGVDFVGAAATQADIINNLVALQQIVADA